MNLKKLQIFAIAALALAGTTFAEAQQNRRSRGTNSAAAEQKTSGTILRFMYWAGVKNDETPDFFYREHRDFKPLQITEMSFAKAFRYQGNFPIGVFRKATEAEIAARKEQGIKGLEAEYVPVAEIAVDKNFKEAGILIPGDIRTARPVVLDFSQKTFPNGSVIVMNMSGMPIKGIFAEPEEGQPGAPAGTKKMEPQIFDLASGKLWTSKPVKSYKILDVQLAIPFAKTPGGWHRVFASSAAFVETSRSVIFVLPSDKAIPEGKPPRVEIRQSGVAPAPTNDSAETDSEEKEEKRSKKEEKALEKIKDKEPEQKSSKRRV